MKQFRRKIQKSISVLLVCIMAISVFAVGVSAEDVTLPSYVKYTITDGEVEITSCSCGYTGKDLVIPETVEGYPVTSIKAMAFYRCDHNTITIPSTIKSMGNRALNGHVEKVIVDENNPYFSSDEYGVLYNKDKTEIIQFPAGSAETSFTVPEGVEELAASSFYDSALTEIILSDTLKTIGSSTFTYCRKLKNVVFSDSVETIDSYAFHNCSSLREITLGAGVSTLGYRAFDGGFERIYISEDNPYFCSDEYGVVYSNDMKTLIKYPYAKSDEKYTIPEGVETIDGQAIDNSYLKELVFSSTIKKNNSTLASASGLERITVSEDNPYFSNDEYGVLYNKDKTELVRCPRELVQTSYVVPDHVEKLGTYAFYFCGSLESLSLSTNITSVSTFALNNCTNLKYLYLPASIRSFGRQSFFSTTKITDIYYLGTEQQWNTLLGKDLDQNDVLLTATVHFNYGLTSGSCGENVTWFYNEENGHLTISGSGALEEKTGFNDYGWYSFRDKITYVEVESGIENVPAFAFDGCTELKEVYLSDSVSSIGESAFSGCDNLKVVSSANENPVSLGENSIPVNENITIICKSGNTALSSLSEINSVIVSFNEEKKILHFEGDITVYPDVEYNFLNKFMLERTNSEYILFDKVVFEGVRPDFIDPSQFENMEAGATNLTLTNLYVSLKVIQGETERTITFEEMLKLLEEGNFDVFKYVIESEEESGEKPFLVRIGEYIVEFAERALRAISSVINFIAKLFKRK